MKVIITGTTGMVGKGVLIECLADNRITEVAIINRHSLNMNHPKLTEIIHKNFSDISKIQNQLQNYDACFFCLGVSAYRMSEEQYTKLTYTLTLNFAKQLLEVNSNMTFCYVSGQGTDSSEKGGSMWARIKGKTENDLMKLGFAHTFMFRPGGIRPGKGIKSRTPMYNTFLPLVKVLYPIFKVIMPNAMTTSEAIGQAMIHVAEKGANVTHLTPKDINQFGTPKR